MSRIQPRYCTAEEYTSCAGTPTDCVPIIGARDSFAARHFAAVCAAVYRRCELYGTMEVPECRPRVVALGSDAMPFARVLASSDSSRLVPNPVSVAGVADCAAADEYLIVVAQPGELPYEALVRLQDDLANRRWGLFHAHNPSVLSLMVAKELVWSALSPVGGPTLVPLRLRNHMPDISTDPPVRLFHNGDCGPEELTKQPIGLLAAMTHGREDFAYLTDAVLCGRHSGSEAHDADGGLPSCAHSGICHRPDKVVLPATELDSEFVFLNSCSNLKTGERVFSSDYSLADSFAAGIARGYIGTSLINDGREWQTLLFSLLMHQGVPVGEAVRQLNAYVAEQKADVVRFILLGSPAARLSDCTQDDGTIAQTDDPDVFFRTSDPFACFAAAPNEPTIVFSPLGAPKTDERAVGKRITARDCGRIARNLSWAAALPSRPPGFQSLTRQLDADLVRVLHASPNADRALESLKRQRRAIATFVERAQEIQGSLIAHVTERLGDGFDEVLWPYFRIDSAAVDVDCPYCHSKCWDIRLSGIVDSERLRRVHKCARCGIVANMPGWDGATQLIISAPSMVRSGERFEVQVHLAQHDAPALDPVVMLATSNGLASQLETLEALDSDASSGAWSYVVQLHERAIPHHYWLTAYGASDCEVVSTTRDILVSTSHDV